MLSSSERTELLVESLVHEGEHGHVRLELATAAAVMSILLNGDEAAWLSQALGELARTVGA